jgi:RND superfamily putative drug exporter
MALSVLVSIAVAATFFPAALALTGDRLFWPRKSRSLADAGADRGPRGRITGLAARFPLVVGLLCLALLASAATGLREMSLGNPVMRGLPSYAGPAKGFAAVSKAFGPGLIAPTLLVVNDPGIGAADAEVARLQAAISDQPGIAGVIGPATGPLGVAGRAMTASGGGAVRFFVIPDSDPYGGTAVDTVARLDSAMPALLQRAGLAGASAGIGGDTALTSELVGSIGDTGLRVGPAAIAWVFLLLALLLRALVAPLYLLAASVLGVAAALGLTVYVFQDLLGYGQLSLFVPFSAAILLLALGSDYSVFVVARIWQESRRHELIDAIRIGGSRAGSAIRTAGLILALSFAAVALIPEQAFRELGFAMAAGLLIDTLIVRALLVPALISAFGRHGAWPGPGLGRGARDDVPPGPEAAGHPATSA